MCVCAFMCVVANLFLSQHKGLCLVIPFDFACCSPHKMNKGANMCVPACASMTATACLVCMNACRYTGVQGEP